MAKRGPQSDLNDRNWDDEEEPEEAGVFKQAAKETINQRVIKKAKRRGQEDSAGGVKTGAFGGFGGLTSKPSFGQNTQDKTVGFKLSTGSDSGFKPNFTGGATSSDDNSGTSSKAESKDNSSYLHGLKSLNESVLAWIKQHVDKNPYIILTPIFKDYEKYLATMESKKATTNGSSSDSPAAVVTKSSGVAETKSLFTSPFSKPPSSETDSTTVGKGDGSTAKASPFSFGSSPLNGNSVKSTASAPTTGFVFGKTSTASSGFSFGLSSSSSAATTTTTSASTGFSFGGIGNSSTTSTFGNSGFSFGNLAAKTMAQGSGGATAAGSSQGSQGDDDEYVPPKPEVKEIKEDDSLYSKRCKLFYQKEGGWTERGVGNIHLKPLEETKTQILVRADTNLGNILLNIMLTSGLPTSRQGKNNVLLVCVPNPPLKEKSGGEKKDGEDQTKPVPMLIRVKTGEEADELLAMLEKRKALL